jgi:hypothetical protein
MNIETVVHIINLILAPAIMITGCALILNGLLLRYESIGGRLRLMHIELLVLLHKLEQEDADHSEKSQSIDRVRRMEIEQQIPRLIQRYTIVRNALVMVEIAGIAFVIDMFAIALGELIPFFSPLTTTPLIGFLFAVTFLLISLTLSIIEAFRSHREVVYEATRGLHFSQNWPR